MVVTETGRTTGVVSGGCLDGDVRDRAARVMQTGRPVLVRYDTTTDDDLVWGLGLGCNGIVHVLIEPAGDRTDALVRILDACSTSQRRVAFATVIHSETPDLPLGARVLLCPDGTAVPDPGARTNAVTQQILADLDDAVRSGVSSITRYGPNAEVETFIEVVEPQVPLVIFGAGADVIPLVTVARNLGWHTTVVDTQARAGSLERFTYADAVILCRPEEIGARVTLTESSVVVLMTHNYVHDRELLQILLNGPTRYIGCLGPRRRTERLLSELPETPLGPWHLCFGRVHAPIGLDVGAETPSEIALSIAAEILAALRNRSGGPLRQRHGSIHGAAEPRAPQSVAVGHSASTTPVVCEPVSR
jgi:xanthine/CO dehydrogenase XdhC/CoxF family maturation factor